MADSLETAVIAMVLQGDALVSSKSKQVTVDLSSAERAGRSAEGAAKTAATSVGELGGQVALATEKMHVAIRVAERLATASGIDSPALSAAGQGVSTFGAVNRLLAPLGPEVSLPLAALAGLYTGVSSYQRSEAEEQKKADELADKIAAKAEERARKERTTDVSLELLRQASLARFDHALGPRTIQ